MRRITHPSRRQRQLAACGVPFLWQGLDTDRGFGVLTDACTDRTDAVAVGLHKAATDVNVGVDLTDIAFRPADADGT